MLLLAPITYFLLYGVALTNGYYTDPHCLDDTRAIVYMFEWTWPDIERECPLLADIGYCGIQVSVPTEHYVKYGAWWERNLPVSYKLESVSGSEVQFRSMVKACSDAGVRVFVSMQLNHMSPGKGKGSHGTQYDATRFNYTGVPYTKEHFHNEGDCATFDIRDWCRMQGYPDLNQTNADVRDKMADLLNSLLDMGVAGFVLEDALRISPKEIHGILEKVNNVQWGGRPFLAYSVDSTVDSTVDRTVDSASSPYFFIGRVTDFKMSEVLGESLMTKPDLSELCSTLTATSLVAKENALIFVDDPTYQRGAHPTGGDTVTFKNRALYEIAQSFVLASDYGLPRLMSSYQFWDPNQGGPRIGVSTEPDGSCGSSWICEHRWPVIEGMVNFSNLLRGQSLQNCLSSSDNVTFTRGDTGYYWASLEPLDTKTIVTSLLPGQYWEAVSNQTGSVLDQSGTTTLDFSGQKVVALIYTGPLATPQTPNTASEVGTIAVTTILPTTAADIIADLPTSTVAVAPILKTATYNTATSQSNATIAKEPQPTSVAVAPTLKTAADNTSGQSNATVGKETQRTSVAVATTLKTATVTDNTAKTETDNTASGQSNATIDIAKEPQPTSVAMATEQPTTPLAETAGTQTTLAPANGPTSRKENQTASLQPTTVKTSDWRRTVIFIRRKTVLGQLTFLRGGNTTGGSIPIRHRTLENYEGTWLYTWAYGDNFLDWKGREESQTGVHKGQKAKGTPMAWTSSDRKNWYYNTLNTYGDHMWVVDVDMDCLKTRGGFFQVKGYSSDGAKDAGSYEPGLILGQKCKGGDDVPWRSRNHWAMCGKINVFTWGKKDCKIESLP